MDKYELGEHGLVIPFGAMFENGDFETLRGYPVVVNVGTVVRNVISACTGSESYLLETLPLQVEMMMDLLSSTFSTLYNMRVIYYRCLYQDVKYGILGQPMKPTQKRELYKKWMAVGVDSLDKAEHVHLIQGSLEGPDDNIPDKTCIITHYAQDLLRHHRFDEFHLIESHTGAVKRNVDFNSKLTLKPELKKIIPFNKFTQRVFGDGTLYGPLDLEVRRNIIAIAEGTGWTKSTPLNRINHLMKANNPSLTHLMQKLLR